jgi:6-pyruvoyltetrahydropterin/6-carboxytetrahydropterin synthase
MIELSRTVRLSLSGPGALRAGDCRNGFSSYPPMSGLGRFYSVRVDCRGPVDAVTGYFLNIKTIDQVVRTRGLPVLERWLNGSHGPSATLPLGLVMRELFAEVSSGIAAVGGEVVELLLELSPFYSLGIGSASMSDLFIRQKYEFSASHRLHVPALSDERNRELFGKCNHPSGHGHNYTVEVSVRCAIDSSGHALPVSRLDELVDEALISKLDHKHLNLDVPVFATVNPSVENIAMIAWEMLDPALQSSGASLHQVTVWETEKTAATYRGPLLSAR